MLLVDYADFNTSNVTIQLPIRYSNKSSINDFNTSNVTIQPLLARIAASLFPISIHLMLLFNSKIATGLIKPVLFQYI